MIDHVMDSDAEAHVRVAACGGKKTFAAVYDQWSRPVLVYLTAALERPADIEDALRATFVVAWRDLPLLRKADRFDRWIFRIAGDHAAELAARETGDSPADASPTDLAALVRALPPRERAALVFRAALGWRAEDVGRALGLKLAAVRRHQDRALERLRAARSAVADDEGALPTDDVEAAIRERFADVAPSSDTRLAVLEAIASTPQAEAPRRRRIEFVLAPAAVVLIAALVLILGALGPDPEPDPVAPEPEPEPLPPLASVRSEDGRFALDLLHVEVVPPPPGSIDVPRVTLQGRVRHDVPRMFVGPGIEVLRAGRTPGPTERKEIAGHRLDGVGFVGRPDGVTGDFTIRGIPRGTDPERLEFVMLKTMMLRLGKFEAEFEDIGPRNDGEKLVPPYRLDLKAEQRSLRVTVSKTPRSIRVANVDMKPPWPSNRTVASSARVVDTTGRVLTRGIGMESGGVASMDYVLGDLGEGGTHIVYPVTITFPDPAPVERIPAVFVLEDIALPPIRGRHVAASPWGAPASGLALRAGLPPRVEQGEPTRAVIELTRKGDGLPSGVNRFEPRDAADFLTLHLTPESGGEEIVIRPDDWTLGQPPPPEAGEPEPNLDRDPPAIETSFPLAREREKLPPGRYEGFVILAVPDAGERRDLHERGDDRLWHGTLRSGPFSLEIVSEPVRRRTVRVPNRVRLMKGLRFGYHATETDRLAVPVRNGYHLGTRVEFVGEDTPVVHLSGVPGSGLEGAFAALPERRGSPDEALLKMTIFLTRDPPGHRWNPKDDLETLWEREFEIESTVEKLEELR